MMVDEDNIAVCENNCVFISSCDYICWLDYLVYVILYVMMVFKSVIYRTTLGLSVRTSCKKCNKPFCYAFALFNQISDRYWVHLITGFLHPSILPSFHPLLCGSPSSCVANKERMMGGGRMQGQTDKRN